jgi:hypothetical protein
MELEINNNEATTALLQVLAELKPLKKFLLGNEFSDLAGAETRACPREVSELLKDIFMKAYRFQLSHAPVTTLGVAPSTRTIEQLLQGQYERLAPSELFVPLVTRASDELTLKATPQFPRERFPSEQDESKRRVLLAQSGPSIFAKMFSGLYKASATCRRHENSQPRITYFERSLLELETDDSLGTALENYFGEVRERRYCKVCKRRTPHTVQATADILPPVLAVSVPRFEDKEYISL